MKYYATFSDGSSAYLEHFGVKGMHWGVWNDETRARRMGFKQRRAEKAKKRASEDLKKSHWRASTEAEAKDAMAADLKKYGRNSDVQFYLGDYMDTYDDPKAIDKALRGKGGEVDRIRKEAASDRIRAVGYKAMMDQLDKMDTSKIDAKKIKKWKIDGMNKVNKSVDEWGSYTVLAEEYRRGFMELGPEQAKKNAEWWKKRDE